MAAIAINQSVIGDVETHLVVDMPDGFAIRADGEVWRGVGDKARPVLYRVGDGWMVCGAQTADALLALAAVAGGGLLK